MTTYTIGIRSLRIVAPSARNPKALVHALGDAFHHHHITTPRRAAYAIAQMAEESDGFRTTEEYATGRAYEGREDLGNTHVGDGVRFKGRGLIMVTGRANYARLGRALHHDFVGHPKDLAEPHWAAMASCQWWEDHGCNELADKRDFVGLTRRINGGTNGLAARRFYLARAMPLARYLVPRPVR